MKKTLQFLGIILFCSNLSYGQDYPNCSHLTIESINITGEGYMDVEVSNSCSDCISGIEGCLYAEMIVVRTVPPYDTVAAADCHCFMSPDNNSSYTYIITTSLTELPPLSDLRISFGCGAAGFCENIPFSENLLDTSKNTTQGISVYPNPSTDKIRINAPGHSAALSVKISDMAGKTVLVKDIDDDEINVSLLAKGLYILTITDKVNNTVENVRFLKQ